MTIRLAVVAAAALSCAACSNQGHIQPMALGFHGQLESIAPVITEPPRAARQMSAEVPRHMKQTLGGKVLSAIALERVTGRKPDPRRFKELR